MPQFESQFEEKFYNERREKLARIAELGAKQGLSQLEATYPNSFRLSTDVPSIKLQYDAPGSPVSGEQLEADKPQAAIAGRLVAIRLQGKAGFATLQQGGQRLQVYVRKDDVGDDAFELYKLLDLGDHIGVHGHLMRTRTGELTLKAANSPDAPALTFLAKAMLPLPDKYSGLGDIELRYRRRYLDLFTDTGDLAEAPETPSPTPTDLSSRPERSEVERPASGTTTEPSSRPERSEVERPASGTTTEPSSRPERSEVERPASGTTTEPSSRPTNGSGETPVLLSQDATTAIASGYPEASASGLIAPPNNDSGATAPQQTRLPARTVFEKRAKILRSIRNFFDTRGYIEVETPMLHTIASGAAARTFSTHHNAEDMELSLRIAPELYLKRLVVGGFDRVYEINRNFRNEGTSTKHNPEFTMLEFYQAYANYHDLMDLTEELIKTVAMEVNGTTITKFNGVEIDLGKWTKLSMCEAIIKFWPPELGVSPDNGVFESRSALEAFLKAAISRADINEDVSRTQQINKLKVLITVQIVNLTGTTADFNLLIPSGAVTSDAPQNITPDPLGRVIAAIFEAVAEEHLIQPHIIYDFPLAVSPLSKVKPDEPDWVERFEFYIGGFEVGNAFSELNDPEDQRNRFLDQLREKERGDDEAMAMDEDYVRALGYGLPPTAGEGIGIDRLTMLLTGSRSIRDVILFPLMRPKGTSPDEPVG